MILLSLVLLVSVFILHRSRNGLPQLPQYRGIYEMEKTLPQHNLDLAYPEGRTGRYVRFANQIAMLGWNNVFNEM